MVVNERQPVCYATRMGQTVEKDLLTLLFNLCSRLVKWARNFENVAKTQFEFGTGMSNNNCFATLKGVNTGEETDICNNNDLFLVSRLNSQFQPRFKTDNNVYLEKEKFSRPSHTCGNLSGYKRPIS